MGKDQIAQLRNIASAMADSIEATLDGKALNYSPLWDYEEWCEAVAHLPERD